MLHLLGLLSTGTWGKDWMFMLHKAQQFQGFKCVH